MGVLRSNADVDKIHNVRRCTRMQATLTTQHMKDAGMRNKVRVAHQMHSLPFCHIAMPHEAHRGLVQQRVLSSESNHMTNNLQLL